MGWPAPARSWTEVKKLRQEASTESGAFSQRA